jgi:hypothetical protein
VPHQADPWVDCRWPHPGEPGAAPAPEAVDVHHKDDIEVDAELSELPDPVATMTTTPELPKKRHHLQNVVLFLVSPFIGIFYAVLLPGKLLQLALAERRRQSDADPSSR